jgi:hypothetical protein
LTFKKNHSNIAMAGINLHATANYQYKEIPFNIGQAPDSVMIWIQSSAWNDTLLSFIGSDLKIDGIYFKSQSVTKTTPVITWSNPANINYGTLLSATQLNATANVVGTLIYTPAIGTKLSAGSNQSLKVDFRPTDASDYNSTSKTININVLKITPVITWSNPADITYGTLLSATQLNATADVDGTFVYTPAIGTKLVAGSNQALKGDFTPTDATDYNSTSKTVYINVQVNSDVSSLSETKINIYPNPAIDNLTIESPENISLVIITSIDGKIVLEKKLSNSVKASISVSDLSPGLYFVSISTTSQSKTVKKLIKTR